MDGDAKGQVGGLDVGEEVRRAYARSSRGWRCEACEGSRGRENEEVMREWWGVCREAGVRVEGEDFGGEFGVDEEEKEKGNEKKEEGVDEAADAGADAAVTAATDTPRVQQEPSSQPQPQPQPQQQLQQHTPPATRPSVPAAPASASASATTSQDTPWLDRAIVGVIIALVAMILRRLTRDMDLE